MKISPLFTAALVGVVSALPQTTQNDLEKGGCKKVTLVFARASTELGNMGESMGPAVCSGLKKAYPGGVACQGVGAPYSAGLAENVLPAGTSAAAYEQAEKMFKMALSKCPDTKLVAGGYSQGTAVMMNAISKIDAASRKKILGVVLFGYTKNGQQKSGIPDYPISNVKVFCAKSDGVCWGKLNVSAGHFSYMLNSSGKEATQFLVSKINGADSSSSASSSEEGDAAPADDAPAEAATPKKSKGKGLRKGKKSSGGERVVDDVE